MRRVDVPRVRVVVVDYNGGDLTLRCLRHLAATEWPDDRFEVVLVDNGSTESILEEAARVMPGLRTVELATNRGFAGGANAGLIDLGDTDYVALVNNDAFVAADWLQPLVAAIDKYPRRGAATAKVLFASPFARIALAVESPTSDDAAIVAITDLRVDEVDVMDAARVASGWAERETDRSGATTRISIKGAAELLIPVLSDRKLVAAGEIELTATREAAVRIDAGVPRAVVLDEATKRIPFDLDQAPRRRVNNAGSCRRPDGSGYDRGFLEPDDGRFDTADEVFAWSGCVALLKREYLDDVGMFDERLFAYYEDLDLALRGRARGWVYRYEPRSVADHLHTATSHEGSDRFVFLNERNRLVVVARHDSALTLVKVAVRAILATLGYVRRDVIRRLLAGRRPSLRLIAIRLRAFVSFLRLLPGTLVRRRTPSGRVSAGAVAGGVRRRLRRVG